jgi:hypothetical protein
VKSSDTLENRGVFDVESVIFFNAIIFLSFLQFHWLFLVFCFVILTEFVILNLIWGQWRFALLISVIANIGSSLLALPFLMFGTFGGSLWFSLINDAALFVTEGESYLFFGILVYVIAFFLSVIVEFLIGKALKAPSDKLIRDFSIANLATYSVIISILFGLGYWFGTTNQDPGLDAWDFFEGKLFYVVPHDSPVLFLLEIGFFFYLVFFLLIFLLVWNYRKSVELPNFRKFESNL